MAKKYLDDQGLLYFWQKIKTLFVSDVTYDSSSKKFQKTKAGTTSDVVTLATVATSGSYNDLSNKPTIPSATSTSPKMDGTAAVGTETAWAKGDHVHPSDTTKVDKETGKGLSTNDYTTAEKNKLSGIASGAEVNQNAFSNVKVGSTTVAADAKTDTLELVAGSNVTLTPDATNDKVTIESDQIVQVSYSQTTASEAWATVHNNFGNKHIYCSVSDLSTIGVALHGFGMIPLFGSYNSGSGNAYYFYGIYDGEFSVNITLTSTSWSATCDNISTENTKNTAGTTNNTGTKLYLVGGTAQQGNIQTYSNGKVYIGTDNCLYSNSSKVATLASPTFTGTPKAPTATAGDSSTQIATTAFVDTAIVQSDWNQTTTTAKDYIKNKPTLGAAAAKGVVTSISSDSTDLPTVTAVKGYVDTAVTGATAYQGIAPTTFAPTNYKAGWYWVIGTAGTYCGQICEAGDMIFCKTAASTYAAADFDVVQTNLDITSITNAEIDTIVAA